jgi:hypothetical protein
MKLLYLIPLLALVSCGVRETAAVSAQSAQVAVKLCEPFGGLRQVSSEPIHQGCGKACTKVVAVQVSAVCATATVMQRLSPE